MFSGTKELRKDVEQALVDIYFYLDKSSKRQNELKHFQRECGVALSKILKHGSTRWLSLQTCVIRLLDQWEPLKRYFGEEVSCTKQPHDRLRRINRFFQDNMSKLYCLFLSEVLPVFTTQNLLLQTNSPQLHRLHSILHEAFTDLFTRYVKPRAVAKCSSIYELDHANRDNQLNRNDLIIGQNTRTYLQELKEDKISSSQEADFFSGNFIFFFFFMFLLNVHISFIL